MCYFLFTEQMALLGGQNLVQQIQYFLTANTKSNLFAFKYFLEFNQDSDGEAEEEPFCQLLLTPEGSETDSESLKDFIVDDDEDDDDNVEHVKSEKHLQQKDLNASNSELLAHYVPQCKTKMCHNSISTTFFQCQNKHSWTLNIK